MKIRNLLLASISSAILASTPAFTQADTKLNACPPQVQSAVSQHSRNGVIEEIDIITVSGHTRYLVDIDLPNRRDKKLQISETGKVLSILEDIRFRDLPENVRTTANGHIEKGSRVEDVERETRDGAITYIVEIEKGNTETTLKIDATGQIIQQTKELQ